MVLVLLGLNGNDAPSVRFPTVFVFLYFAPIFFGFLSKLLQISLLFV